MTTSINTNISAYFAQNNLRSASSDSSSSIARLSSGNRIIRAADDVAALSVGTILRTNVSTLRTALSNTNQANSLLQVADGGLQNVGEILQRQKALSVQATSGTLSAAERGFLNQEFQNLADEIDRLVDNTKFNQVKLLDGSLSKAVLQSFNTEDTVSLSTVNNSAASGTIMTLNAVGTDGDILQFNGVKVELTTDTIGTDDAAGKVIVGATVTATAENITAYLNSSADARVANFRFTNAAGVITALYAGGRSDGSIDIAAGTVDVTTPANYTGAASVINATAANQAGLSEDRVFALGSVTGDVLNKADTTATDAGQALDLSNDQGATLTGAGIQNNAAFIGQFGEGSLSSFDVSYTGTANEVIISVTAGDIRYVSAATVMAVGVNVELLGEQVSDGVAGGGNFTLNIADWLAAVTDGVAINNQQEADELAEAINDGLKDVTIVQNRDVTSFNPPTTAITVNGAEIGTLDGMSVDYRGSNFDNITVEDVKVYSPSNVNPDAVIEVVINGETFRSYEGLGTIIEDDTVISLRSLTDPNKALSLVTGATGIASDANNALDITNEENALAIQDALISAFGIADGKGKLVFQTGSAVSDNIAIEVQSAKTESLYARQSLDVLTVENAQNAGAQIDIAINYVTALRANVGALQSRFDYAAANLETSIQNQDAARGTFLDADISAESTMYASSQVLLQASISVLAQANQLPQNLLKLIG